MYYLRLVGAFIRLSIQQEMAYPVNFFISLMYSAFNLLTGIVGLVILFNQVQSVQGWTLASSLGLLGVYLIVGALRDLVFGPSFDILAGIGGEVWTGKFDFTMLRPVSLQFLTSFRYWRVFSFIDLFSGILIVCLAMGQLRNSLTPEHIGLFLIAIIASVTVLYAILLMFVSLIFWSPGFLFTWVFDGLFQMARYPVSLYPNWIRMVLMWIIPVGIMTTVPAQALSGDLPVWMLLSSVLIALILLIGASLLFRLGSKRYASASS
jgi:ABC-2 type transport system permease protein